MMMKTLFIIFLFIFCFQGCTSYKFNKKDDYLNTKSALERNYINKAIEYFPGKEKNSFITIMEKTYLNLLNGNPEIEDLLRLEKKVDKQVRYKVSKELKSFFYLETPDGYYPSEHEIIWMHLLLSWGFSLKKEFDSARVEAKKASILLRGDFGEKGRFDDATLRIMLGMMWAISGDWENAQVDFRKAAILNSNLWWAKKLGHLNKKPKNIFFILGGIGPEVYWSGLSEGNNVNFKGSGYKSELFLAKQDLSKKKKLYLTPDASLWYKRHLKRNNWATEFIGEFQYTNKNIGSSAVAAAKIAASIVIGATIMVAGLAAGGAILYLGIVAESGELAGAGILVGIGGVSLGAEFISESTSQSIETHKEIMDPSKDYRFVRFLPEYCWLGWADSSLEEYNTVINGTKRMRTFNKIQLFNHDGQNIYLGYYADRIHNFININRKIKVTE